MAENMTILPDVTLTDSAGKPKQLRDYLGAPLVLYFYPKDDTPGCTREAQDFSALYPQFHQAGAAVLGVSLDPPAKHARFTAKHGLSVPLATDADKSAMEALGVWIEKSLYGRKYMGIDRATFLFDRDGRLVRDWRKVKVAGHAQAVLEAVRALA